MSKGKDFLSVIKALSSLASELFSKQRYRYSLGFVPRRLYMINFLAVVSWYISGNWCHILAFMYFAFQCESGCFMLSGGSFFRPL